MDKAKYTKTNTKNATGCGVKNYMDKILENLALNLRSRISKIKDYASIQEIRIRVNQPVRVSTADGSKYISLSGMLVTSGTDDNYLVPTADIESTLELISEGSVYTFIEEIRKGFITIKGGHRIGISGKVITKNQNISNIREINSLNIRIAREIKGASDKILSQICDEYREVHNTLIIAPPNGGKTTALRDLTRLLSQKYKISLIDERCEIAACYQGKPQLDIGPQTDVLELCPKAEAMLLMLRSMSPDIIITDEVTCQKDLDVICQIINCGVKIITSIHGFTLDDIKARMPDITRIFSRIIILKKNKGVPAVDKIIKR